MSRDAALEAIGGIVLALLGVVVGYKYQGWETRPKLEIKYVIPRYDISFQLPPNLVKELLGQPDVVQVADALVAWRVQPALQLNSFQRREFEDLLMLQKPLQEQAKSQFEDM